MYFLKVETLCRTRIAFCVEVRVVNIMGTEDEIYNLRISRSRGEVGDLVYTIEK